MEKQIIELWVKNDERKEFLGVIVVSTYKGTFSHTEGGITLTSEQIMALCYFEETGEIIEYPLNECHIKSLIYEKGREPLCFSKPDYETGKGE